MAEPGGAEGTDETAAADARASETPAQRGPATESTTPFSIDDLETSADQIVSGATIGRYQVRRVVGSGGMGVVVAAHDLELGRSVAIKMLSREHEGARSRLVREAQAMARLSHPNVVTVHEVLRLGDRAAIVMELVEGHDLAAWRDTATRTWREIVGVYVQAARGLAAAHRAGLVHRDFKPANALIDRDGVVRVTDFGIVRSTDDGPADPEGETLQPGAALADPRLTRTGTVLGTPAYMAPEQHRSGTIDPRTDQWALACALYGALYGQRAFAGTTVAELASNVLAGVIRAEPAEPKVPRAIRAAIRKGLALRPEDRFANMDALIAALTPARRTWQIAAGVAVAATAAVTVLAITRGGEPAATCDGLDQPVVAAWNPTTAGALRARFTSVVPGYGGVAADHVVSGLDEYAASWVAARTHACTQGRQGVGSHELLDRRMRCLDQRLVEVSSIVGGLVAADAKVVQNAGVAIDRLHAIVDCDDPRDPVPRPTDPAARAEIARAEDTLARAFALAELGDQDGALPLAREAAAVGERTGWTPLVARALVAVGRDIDREQDNVEAMDALDRAASAAAQAKDDAVLAEALTVRFYVLGDRLGKGTDALAGRQYIELALERAGQPRRLRALWLHNLAIVLLDLGKYDEALAAETEAVAILRAVVRPGHSDLVDALQTLGNIEINRNELDHAEALLNEVMAARVTSRGPEHPEVASTLTNLGVLAAQRGDLPGAIAKWERAVVIERAAGYVQWSRTFNLALARFYLGRWAASIEDLIAALALAEETSPGDTRPVAFCTTALGGAYLARGDLELAAPLLERAIKAARGSGSPSLSDALAYAAQLAIARGELAVARTQLADAKAVDAGGPQVAFADAEVTRASRGCTDAVAAFTTAIAVATKAEVPAVVTDATVALGECQLELGRGRDAVATLTPRVAWLEQGAADPGAAARAKAALARGLIAVGGDRAQARALAEAAARGYATLGPGAARQAAALRSWQQRQKFSR